MNKSTRVFIALCIAVFVPVGFWLYYNVYVGMPKPLRKWFPTGEVIKHEVNGKTKIDSVYHTIADFKFVNQNGTIITNDSFKNKIYIANFFFCSCQSICPKLMKQLVGIQEEFKQVKWLKILSYTVDPEHDSVMVLKKYANRFGVDDTKWSLVTGNLNELYNLCKTSYYLAAQSDGPESFDHSCKFVLVDNHRIIRGYYDGLDSVDVARLKKDVVVLLKELSNDVNELHPPRQ